jgi:hypothetical protein
MEELRIRAIIEILGIPKEHVEETMQKVVDLIKQNQKLTLIDYEIAELKQIEKLWSTFGEFELEIPDIEALTDFCFEFMPSSIEIIEPDELKTSTRKIENSFNDILAKLHQYDMALKKVILQQRVNLKNSRKENQA